MFARTLLTALSLVFLMLLSPAGQAQDHPDKIRGYKVHKAKVHVSTSVRSGRANDNSTVVNISEPRLIDVGLTGVAFEADADIDGIPETGKIDLLMFRDFRVNGVSVEIDEYTHPFEMKKGVAVKLPKPLRAFVSSASIAKAVYKEMVESEPMWKVTGTVLVFGRFKKFGFTFKRVIPVAVELKVKNPAS